MLKIRLSRRGKKSQPSYSVVVQEHSAPVKKKFIEELGHYMPATQEKTFTVNIDRVKHWLSVGAQPTDAVAVQLRKAGVDGMDKFIAPRDKKKRPTKEPAPVEAKAPVAPVEEPKAQAPAAEVAEAPAEEAAPEAPVAEAPEEAPAE